MTSPHAHTETGSARQPKINKTASFLLSHKTWWDEPVLIVNFKEWIFFSHTVIVKIEQNVVHAKIQCSQSKITKQSWSILLTFLFYCLLNLFLNFRGYLGCSVLNERKKGMICNRGGMSGINASSLSSGCGRRLLPEIIFRKG